MTRTVVIWVELLLRVVCLLLFPALAVWAWRAGIRDRFENRR